MKEILDKLTRDQALTQNEVDEVISGLKENRFSETQIADLLTALIMKRPTTAEVAAIAHAISQACVAIKPRFESSPTSTELNQLIRNQGLPS